MLDLFSIFTKGGIVLWYIQGTALSLTPAVNALIKSVILQERGGAGAEFNHGRLTLHYKMDNEFELIYVVAHQNIVKLSYVDKLLEQVSLAFRDRYKNDIISGPFRAAINFTDEFEAILSSLEQSARINSLQPRVMKTFAESKKFDKAALPPPTVNTAESATPVPVEESGSCEESPRNQKALAKLGTRGRGGGKRNKTSNKNKPKESAKPAKPAKPVKAVKAARMWVDGKVSRSEAADLDCSGPAPSSTDGEFKVDYSLRGGMKDLQPLEVGDTHQTPADQPEEKNTTAGNKTNSGGGMMSFFKNLTSGKVITREIMTPVLEKMKEHLITKNVAMEIADKVCESVATKLDGKVISTFSGIQSTVRDSMEESLVQILSPKRRIDILRDVLQSSEAGKPYVVTFCGVNGVGKSTNLAKVAFWLLENGYRVLIAACDTFRSGAVEQLRTHARHLGALHPPNEEGAPANILLYDKGYGKDAAGVAMEAIHYAHQQCYNVVLIDTAGRMQDNEPLMRALAKLIRVNNPDLVLFVGEALVGNEAVDQLYKFNRALVDHSEDGNTRTIDGILLTKFDTIDDKVGAAVSMTYTTGQPIVFIGTGQSYKDLKSLNAQAVVSVLLK